MMTLPCGICGRRHALDLSCHDAERSKHAHRCYLGDDCCVDGLTHDQIVEFTTLRHPLCDECARYAHETCAAVKDPGACLCRALVCRTRRQRAARDAGGAS